MKRLFAILICTLLGFSLAAPAVAAINAGDKCSTKGAIKISNGKRFQCIKTGKKQTWRLQLDKSSQGKKVIEINYSRNHKNYLEMQKLVQQLSLEFKDKLPNLTIVRELDVGSNGQWETKIEKSITDSLGFLENLGMNYGTDPVEIAVGRNSLWFKSYFAQRCQDSNAGGDSKFGSSSAYVCGPMRERGILTNPATVLSRMEIDTVSKIDLDTLSVSPSTQIDFLTQLPHEFFHVYQEEKWRKISKNYEYVPLWFREGSATVVGLVVATLSFSTASNYTDVKNLQLLNMPKGLNQICKESIRSMDLTVGSGCQYFQGAVAVEVLMVNHGGWNVLRKLTEGLGDSNFENDFLRIVGIPLETFYDEVDRISKDFGYASKI